MITLLLHVRSTLKILAIILVKIADNEANLHGKS